MKKFVSLLLCLLLAVLCLTASAETFTTEHFSVEIPDGWISKAEDPWYYFYAQTVGVPDGGYVAMTEMNLAETSGVPATALEIMLDEVFASIVSGMAPNEEDVLVQESRDYNGLRGWFTKLNANVNGETLCVSTALAYKDGYVLAVMYSNGTENSEATDAVAEAIFQTIQEAQAATAE